MFNSDFVFGYLRGQTTNLLNKYQIEYSAGLLLDSMGFAIN